MATETQTLAEQAAVIPPDDIENLYVGRIEQVIGRINDTDDGLFEGEVLLYGRADEGVFIVEKIRRFALYGSLVDNSQDERFGLISFAGPLNKVDLIPGPKGTATGLWQQIHYDELSAEVNPLYREDEVEYPWVEALTVNLTWEWISEDPTEPEQRLNIGLPDSELIGESAQAGRISSLTFGPTTLSFYRAGSGLAGNLGICLSPKNPPCPEETDLATVARQWPLKFINISGQPNSDIEGEINNQITGVCNTWWQKAALNVASQPQLEDGAVFLAAYPNYALIDTSGKARGLATLYNQFINGALTTPPYHVEVYVVQAISGQVAAHGGVTRNNGQASAYCILQADKLPQNQFLLAHELGHALGLNEVASGPGVLQSVMIPGTPNSSQITLDNCQILTGWGGDPAVPGSIPVHPLAGNPAIALNAIVRAVPGSDDCLRPDQ